MQDSPKKISKERDSQQAIVHQSLKKKMESMQDHFETVHFRKQRK